MGPRPCGRGRASPTRQGRAATLASMGPRPCGRGRLPGGTRSCACLNRFNGATALRPWTAAHCGRAPPPRSGFNGATALRPWTGGRPESKSRTRTSFNGATALRPWTEPKRARLSEKRNRLQWGHGLAAVDGPGPGPTGTRRNELQWGHGLAAVDGWSPWPKCSAGGSRFNGATALRPWTVALGPRRRPPHPASMGPRPCGRGRNPSDRLALGDARGLQWGHGLAAVDGAVRQARQANLISFNGATALRPWTGRSPCLAYGRICRLQWGHGLAAVDGRFNTGHPAAYPVLQWGHGLAAVDGRERPRSDLGKSRASMGPRPCGRGRQQQQRRQL